MLSEQQIAEGWLHPVTLADMVGCKIVYQNTDSTPTVRLEAWLDSVDEGWAVVEFSDGSRATVRPSRIIAYKPEPKP